MSLNALIQLSFLLVLSLLALGVAISFAYRPTERKLSILRPLALALVFALIGITFGGIACTFKNTAELATFPQQSDSVHQMMAGFAEAFVPGMVGFAILAIVWGLAALGFKRQV